MNPGAKVDWVIVGGESGPKARPCVVSWVRRVIRDCRAKVIPVFVKQLGRNVQWTDDDRDVALITDPKGGDPGEWPVDLAVREWPEAMRFATA